jgi:ubiquinone/menaquinone biosynthesis C-methylase UbiE
MFNIIKFKTKLKKLTYSILNTKRTDNLRSIFSQLNKIFYDYKKAKEIKDIVETRKIHIKTSEDVGLLLELHKYFKTIDLKYNYEIDSLMNAGRLNCNNLISKGIKLEGKDIVDLGAGHGQNLLMVKEFKFKSATGLDYSDTNFLPHKDEVDPEIFNAIDFITTDLIEDEIGSEFCDVIFSFSAFEHFQHPDVVLDKCYRALRKGGILYAEFSAFHSAYASHRKIFTGVPYVQNIFNEETAFDFYYNKLKINEGINRYTKEQITDGNPFPEINRWTIKDFNKIFLDKSKWQIIDFTKVYNYKFSWLVNIFKEQMKELSQDDIYVNAIKYIIQKK